MSALSSSYFVTVTAKEVLCVRPLAPFVRPTIVTADVPVGVALAGATERLVPLEPHDEMPNIHEPRKAIAINIVLNDLRRLDPPSNTRKKALGRVPHPSRLCEGWERRIRSCNEPSPELSVNTHHVPTLLRAASTQRVSSTSSVCRVPHPSRLCEGWEPGTPPGTSPAQE
jgi:hypothetical protein